MKKIILEGIKKCYWANQNGEIFIKKKGIYKQIHQQYNKQRTSGYQVSLLNYNNKFIKYNVDKLILKTFGKYKGKFFCIVHKNNNYADNSLSNLEQVPRENVGLWDVLTDDEFLLWKQKLFRLDDDKKIKRFNDIAWEDYCKQAHRLNRNKAYRKKFMDNLFK